MIARSGSRFRVGLRIHPRVWESVLVAAVGLAASRIALGAVWVDPAAGGVGGAGRGASPARPDLTDQALRMLDEGNRRFVEGRSVHPNTDVFRVGETGEHGQHPFAAVLACADSRVAVERLFDRGMGDLFVVRVAGNIGDPNQAGSLEYACEHLGTRLVVVMGHTGCGAVKAAVEGVSTGTNIGSLLDNIAPAVREVRAAHPELSGEGLVEAVVRQNVWRTIEDTLRGSASLRAGVQSEAVRMVGAVYDVRNGRVEWMGNHPALAGLLASGATGHGQASAAPTPTEMLAPAAKTPGERTPASPGHAAKPGVKGPAAVKPSDEQHTPAHTAHPH